MGAMPDEILHWAKSGHKLDMNKNLDNKKGETSVISPKDTSAKEETLRQHRRNTQRAVNFESNSTESDWKAWHGDQKAQVYAGLYASKEDTKVSDRERSKPVRQQTWSNMIKI